MSVENMYLKEGMNLDFRNIYDYIKENHESFHTYNEDDIELLDYTPTVDLKIRGMPEIQLAHVLIFNRHRIGIQARYVDLGIIWDLYHKFTFVFFHNTDNNPVKDNILNLGFTHYHEFERLKNDGR